MNIDHMAYYPINIEESGPPLDGDVVMVSGGIAQYRGGEWFSGMEIPPFQRPITWEVTHYMPIPIFGPNEITEDPYEVVINHTDPGEIKTALALAEKKLAKAEKELAKHQWVSVEDRLPEAPAFVLLALPDNDFNTWHFHEGEAGLRQGATHWKTMITPEDVLIPDKGGGLPECQWRRPCGTCYNLGSINSGGACSPHCSAPNKVEDVLIPDKK